ncbi:MAG: glycoside hydrolase family 88 protein [Polyangiaceae bacterium]|nr:glycoside hydrolase family 88 protein [Polyangiaceae bacterium]
MRHAHFFVVAATLLSVSPTDAWSLDVVSPTKDGLVIGDTARIIVHCGDAPTLHASIAGQSAGISWTRGAYGNGWVGDLKLPSKGDQAVTLEGQCGGTDVSEPLQFNNGIEKSVEVAEQVIARFFSMNEEDKLEWNWGPAIFLYPLLKIAPKSTHSAEYIDYVARYHQRHIEKGLPKIEWADRCPSALSAFDLAVKHGRGFAWPSVETVMEWIATAKRNPLGSIDHLGYDNAQSFFFPSSIWVDSLMMWAVLTVKYGLRTDDDTLLSFGLEQPFIFASKLRQPYTGLYHHAWNIEAGQPYPADNVPWLRGNGWVLVSLAEMLEEIGWGHDRYDALAALFVNLAEASLTRRQPSGYWDTVVDNPGYAYEESSGSALLAYGYAKGTRLGLLSPKFRYYARDTFRAITARMKRRSTGFTMEEISIGTNPTNKVGYSLIPTDRNVAYGVGAFLLLADELSGDSFGDSAPGADTQLGDEQVPVRALDDGQSAGSCGCRQLGGRPPQRGGLASLCLVGALAWSMRRRSSKRSTGRQSPVERPRPVLPG